MTLKLAELSQMPESARNRALTDLVRSATRVPNGQLAKLDAEIHQLEVRYGMTSDAMLSAFRDGTLKDTADLARWHVLLQVRARVVR